MSEALLADSAVHPLIKLSALACRWLVGWHRWEWVTVSGEWVTRTFLGVTCCVHFKLLQLMGSARMGSAC